MPTLHLLIKGKVQGVSYRFSAKQEADRLSLTGWVRNTSEGHVEITVSGPEHPLEQFVSRCRQGPPYATVTAVDTTSLSDTFFPLFTIRRG